MQEAAVQGFESPFSVALSLQDRAMIDTVNGAIARRAGGLAFQPVIDARDPARVLFHEGLLRLFDEGGTQIRAGEFMGLAETREAGRILDCMALELGLQALRKVPGLRLSVNMSARSIGYPRWNETLGRALTASPEIGRRLILEITESSAMLMPDIVTVFMADLQRRGVSFALDDFGAGFTAFRYLKEFYFDIVKIDGQFIRGIDHDTDNQVLTAALVSIAQQFDMFTVAEAVETEAEAAFLRNAGVDCLQGYHFGAPRLRPDWLPLPDRVSLAG